MRTVALALAMGALAASPIRAQPAPADVTPVTTAAPTANAPATAPAAPQSVTPRPVVTPGPSQLEQTGVSPDGPQSYSDLAWDARIRASVAAAQSLQGPLDGRWTLYDGEGRGLFVFQFVDPAGGRGPLEGVWRDLRRPPGSLAYGMVVSLASDGTTLTAAFAPRPGGPLVTLNLQGLADGRWSGEMTDNGAKLPVTLRRY
ncbi:MAG TPA: hypothetical protein VFE03_00560 [Caulobacteraceae bacterium]|jgi:hypothetical protein|nr:hypothetical protein [Caulobacteraceae bacterium]